MPRQPSQNELKAKKEEVIIIQNVSKQIIAIQLSSPVNPKTGKKIGFFVAEQSVSLPRGKSGKFPRARLYMDQITNLQKSGMIKVKRVGEK